ncbi:glycine zipper family protein [Saccharopolyspora erythraea]|uniref:general stress protein n=1 Tax=Saccharopolyspora erythraea TaxID=1836 RepID=UPI001BA59E68|nr:general stress protein [Saccharopolyspora erythraea]QUH03524.1 glycine zipper family protein [Saccharopolyspora erythraea]
MSEQQSPAPGTGDAPEQRQARRPVATYDTYAEAERAVDHLSDQHFPVERVAIVGHDVKLVEQVVGRLNYGRAAAHGAGGGALTGVLFGWIFGLFSWIQPLLASFTLALYGLVFGAVIGALIGLLMHAMQGGRRDFSAVRAMEPSRYEVLVDTEVADEAARLLQQFRNPQPGGAAG